MATVVEQVTTSQVLGDANYAMSVRDREKVENFLYLPVDESDMKNVKAVYVPLGAIEPITLTYSSVLASLVHKTKKGDIPGFVDVVRFIALCFSQKLNPYVNDAYLIGYDTNYGPSFSLITSASALIKRAELNPQFDGLESGIVVLNTKTGEVSEGRHGSIVRPGEKLLGAWARCYRKDRAIPVYDELAFDTYSTGLSRWSKDGPGMIVKCARAAVLRVAFPNLSGLYVDGELDSTIEQGRIDKQASQIAAASARIAADLGSCVQSHGTVVDGSVVPAKDGEEQPKQDVAEEKPKPSIPLTPIEQKHVESFMRDINRIRSGDYDEDVAFLKMEIEKFDEISEPVRQRLLKHYSDAVAAVAAK